MADETDDFNSRNTLEEKIRFADDYCVRKGLNFTAVRRKVLELLIKSDRAIGAYKLLDHLREAGFKSQPPVAYRALDFLLKHGFVHKVAHLNAFVACVHPGVEHAPAFMICRNCDSVSEMDTAYSKLTLTEGSNSAGFKIEGAVIEATGLCGSCIDVESK